MLVAMRVLAESSSVLVALITAIAGSLLAVIAARGIVRSIALGIATGVAAAAGLAADDLLDAALAAGLLLILVAALASEARSPIVRAAALAPGGVLIVTLGAEGTAGWARALAFVTIVAVGPTAVALDRFFPYLTVALLAVSALGAYWTLPDTEQARALVGALLPVALLALVFRHAPEPSSPSLGVALVAWVALVGGVGRAGSVVGAIGCLGVLALGPLARRGPPILVVAAHLPIVVIASRVAGLRQSAWTAAAVLLPVIVLAAAILLLTGQPSRKVNPP